MNNFLILGGGTCTESCNNIENWQTQKQEEDIDVEIHENENENQEANESMESDTLMFDSQIDMHFQYKVQVIRRNY